MYALILINSLTIDFYIMVHVYYYNVKHIVEINFNSKKKIIQNVEGFHIYNSIISINTGTSWHIVEEVSGPVDIIILAFFEPNCH